MRARDKQKLKSNFVLVFVIVMVYVVLAYFSRGYYAVGLEVFTPAFLYVAWLYADKDNA